MREYLDVLLVCVKGVDVLMAGVSGELQDTVGGVLEANTTRTTIVIKLKKDVDIMLSPMALESAQLFLEVGTVVKRRLS